MSDDGKELDRLLNDALLEGGGYGKRIEALHSQLLALRTELSRAKGTGTSVRPRTHLIIGDSHSDPEIPNDRYRWLGRFVNDLGPDIVVDIGDWADMGSLSHFDIGKRAFEGRRYHKDIAQAIKAREEFNKQLRGHKPHLIACLGNHEQRIVKATDDLPHLEGLISTNDLKVKELGWEQYDFQVPVVVDGIAYCHYFPSGVKGKPIGGMNLASNMIRLGLMSCVQGHSHTFDYSERTRADGGRVLGMSVGCYFSHFMSWAGSSNQMYWRGIVVLKDVVDGYGTIEQHSIESIEAEYGGS